MPNPILPGAPTRPAPDIWYDGGKLLGLLMLAVKTQQTAANKSSRTMVVVEPLNGFMVI